MVSIADVLGRDPRDDEKAPGVVYVQGSMGLPLPGPRVAVVGSRNATKRGLEYAKTVSSRLASEGVIIVSGLAKGIDAAAHEAAIDSGGRTIAVLGTPLDRFYPWENRFLQAKITRDHLAISQFPSGHDTVPWDFVARDKTIALLSDAVLVVEFRENGGSLHACREALRLGKKVLIPDAMIGTEWAKTMEKFGATILDDHAELSSTSI